MYLGTGGPPNSPPIDLFRRKSKIRITKAASEQNSVTENAKLKKEIFY